MEANLPHTDEDDAIAENDDKNCILKFLLLNELKHCHYIVKVFREVKPAWSSGTKSFLKKNKWKTMELEVTV